MGHPFRTSGVARLSIALIALAVLAAACSSSSSSKPTASAPPSVAPAIPIVDLRTKTGGGNYPEAEVSVVDNRFDPPGIRVGVGVTVSWRNDGRSVHNLRASDPEQSFGTKSFGSDRLAPKGEYEYRFTKPGVYRYYCSLHGSATRGMVGVVVVGDVAVDDRGAPVAAKPLIAGTLRVPQQYPTIQAAVDAAAPGALVLVDRGIYHEAVHVDPGHEGIVIRGVSREGTVLDGQFDESKPNGVLVQADGVAIENMTGRNYTTNAFYWRGVQGYRGSYLSAYRTGDYGLYAFDSVHGQFDHDYAAGSKDAGYYIGQCAQCDAVIIDSIAEWNGLGYSGTNASGNLVIARSTWRYNRAGIVPNSETGEELSPQHGITIVGNSVYSNNNAKTAAIDIAQRVLGNGILLGGARDNVVLRNRVSDHDVYGIAAIPLPEKVLDPSNAKAQNFDALGNQIRDNVVTRSRVADLAAIANVDDVKNAGGNCFSGNTYSSSSPPRIEALLPCGSPQSKSFQADLPEFVRLFGGVHPAEVDYRKVKLPALPDQPDLPGGASAPVVPARVGVVPMRVVVDDIPLPTR